MKQEKSCGCVVWNDGKILLIKNVKGHWDLPKGHVEGEETEEETAIRELKEETNIDVEIISEDKLQIEYSPEEGVWKKVIYFAAREIGGEIRPQEEEVEKVGWFSAEEALETLTFEDTKKVLQQMIEKNLFKQ